MIIDSHAHLDMDKFCSDRDRVIARARDSGVGTIINVGIDLKSSLASIELAKKYGEIIPAVGFHPHDTAGMTGEDVATLRKLAQDNKVVAIGEIGLDYYRNLSPREIQLRAFRQQLELAGELNLPVIIHSRQAQSEVMGILDTWQKQRRPGSSAPGVIHCFSGNLPEAQHYIAMGFYLSFTATITYPNARHTAEIIRGIPRDRIFVETDCPFLPPQQHRGSRNEPSYVVATLERVAQVLEIPVATAAQITTQNVNRLFGCTNIRG